MDEQLRSHNLATPTFDPDVPLDLFDGVEAQRQSALRAMDELQALLVGLHEIPGQTSVCRRFFGTSSPTAYYQVTHKIYSAIPNRHTCH
jgi:hypothetical protein